MKKMLDELKKLDEEYIVPANFKSNVMKRIKDIDTVSIKNTNKHLNKYVISWLSTAAIVIIAIVVSLNGTVENSINQSVNDMANINLAPTYDKSEMEDSLKENMKDQALTEENETDKLFAGAESQTSNNRDYLNDYKTQIAFDSIKDILKPENADNAIEESVNTPNNSDITYSNSEELNNKTRIYLEIIKILLKENIEIVGNGDNFITINLKVEDTKEILSDYIENIILTEENEITNILVKD